MVSYPYQPPGERPLLLGEEAGWRGTVHVVVDVLQVVELGGSSPPRQWYLLRPRSGSPAISPPSPYRSAERSSVSDLLVQLADGYLTLLLPDPEGKAFDQSAPLEEIVVRISSTTRQGEHLCGTFACAMDAAENHRVGDQVYIGLPVTRSSTGELQECG